MLIVWTVGHSARTLGEFLELLTANEIEAVADVRRYAASRKHPHFNRDALRNTLSVIGVGYVPLPELSGRRRPRSGSQNIAWRSESFRVYADYMETEEFRAGIERLMELVHWQRTAIMCAGSGMVEVSSVADRRLPEGGRRLCATYHQREKERDSPLHVRGTV